MLLQEIRDGLAELVLRLGLGLGFVYSTGADVQRLAGYNLTDESAAHTAAKKAPVSAHADRALGGRSEKENLP